MSDDEDPKLPDRRRGPDGAPIPTRLERVRAQAKLAENAGALASLAMNMVLPMMVEEAQRSKAMLIFDFRTDERREDEPTTLDEAKVAIGDWRDWARDLAEVLGVAHDEGDDALRDAVTRAVQAKRDH